MSLPVAQAMRMVGDAQALRAVVSAAHRYVQQRQQAATQPRASTTYELFILFHIKHWHYFRNAPKCDEAQAIRHQAAALLTDRAPLKLLKVTTNAPLLLTPTTMPLFWSPANSGCYAPAVGEWSVQRENAYRNVGR